MREHPLSRIQRGLQSRYPLFYVLCQDEARLESLLALAAARHFGAERSLVVWTSASGFQPGDAGLTDPQAAVRHILQHGQPGFYLLKDLPAHFAGQPQLVRALRDLYQQLAARDIYVFISYPVLQLPEELKNHVFPVDLGMPDEGEILACLRQAAAALGVAERLTDDWYEQAGAAMKGMALNEIQHLMRRLVAENHLELAAAMPEIVEEKASALMKEGCLKYISQVVDVERVGGLAQLKEWVVSRRSLFTRAAFQAGLPLPKGILFMGVSGCGKSMAAKVIASAWNLPLVRLDMNLVMSGAFGPAEYAFDRSLRVAEQVAPLVLWIDEMENSFGYDSDGGGTNQNIFSSFLTWMQEKPDTVFVVATANRIEKLPAEVIRKGRFDQLFFLDLPSEEERKAILAIHIRALGGDPASFNLNFLAAATRNWSGAEIEQAVKAARIRAYQEKRPFTEADVSWNTGRMVPLSRTMEEQIKQLRIWSQSRATPAS